MKNETNTEYGRIVAENDNWVYYVNDMTRQYAKSLSEYDSNGFTLKGMCRVVLAHRKSNGYMAYVALDMNGEPFADWTGPEEFHFKLKMILFDLADKCDIVNMAEKKLDS